MSATTSARIATVAFLVADSDQVQPLHDPVRKHLAIKKILDSDDWVAQLGEEVIAGSVSWKSRHCWTLRVAISRCYCHLYFSTKDEKNADRSPTRRGRPVDQTCADSMNSELARLPPLRRRFYV